MKNKEEIVANWLPRYTGLNIDSIGEYILLTNFNNYVRMFAAWNQVPETLTTSDLLFIELQII